MAADETDAGARALYELSRRLKEVGGTGRGSLRNEMAKALRAAAKPLPQAVKKAARDKLPRQGGLNEIIAKRTPKVVLRTGALTAGVRVQDKSTDPRLDEGRIAHPVFGRPGSVVVQNFPDAVGYFSETLRDEAPTIRGDVLDVLEDFTRRIPRGL